MTVTPAAPPSADGLTPEQVDLQQRARRFVDEVLIPNEELAERSGGHLSEELIQRIKREAIAAGLSGGLHAPEHGGQGWSITDWFLVEEQLGRSTNALSWYIPNAYNVLASGTRRADRPLPAARRCAASSTTPTRSRRPRPARTRPGSRRPRARPTPAG